MHEATVTASPPRFPFVEARCAWCDHNPCRCRLIREERCACGAMISADGRRAIASVVAAHNESLVHLAWRRRCER